MQADPPRLAVVAVGDELLFGRVLDSNSGQLGRLALDAGFEPVGVQQVGDGQDAIVAALHRACATAELVLVTGGLGPTLDDRTRHALAALLGKKLRTDAAVLRTIRAYWRQLGRRGPMPAANRRQALIPEGARILANDRGTAPGLLARHGAAWIACLPGVPHEMEAMASRLFAGIGRFFPGLLPPTVTEIHLAGIGESRVQDILGDLLDGEIPRVGINAHEAGHLTIRIVGRSAAVARRATGIRRKLPGWLLPEGDVAASLASLLTKRGRTIAVAESCTCGQLAARLGAVPGASKVLQAGWITYANAMKERLLGVPAGVLRRHGAVSQQVVEAMALGARAAAGADHALATSGIAGPDGGSRAKPVGTVWLAHAGPDGVRSQRVFLRGSRTRIQARAAAMALLLAWECIAGRSE